MENKNEKLLAIYQENRKKTRDLMDMYSGEIGAALPSFIRPEILIRVALTAMNKNPALMECTQHSILSAVLTCAQLGLMPDSVIGEAYLVPFNNTKKRTKECQVIIGYRGLCTLAMRSGHVKSIQAFAVYAANEPEGDKFDYSMGLNEKLEHMPSGLTDSDRITHFYAIVRFLNGGSSFLVLTRAQVEAVRNEAPNYKHSKNRVETFWVKYFAEMGCKTVLRKLLKTVPMSADVNKALALEDAAERGEYQKNSLEFLNDFKNEDFVDMALYEVLEEQQDKAEEQLQENKTESVTRAKKATEATEKAILKKNPAAAKKPAAKRKTTVKPIKD